MMPCHCAESTRVINGRPICFDCENKIFSIEQTAGGCMRQGEVLAPGDVKLKIVRRGDSDVWIRYENTDIDDKGNPVFELDSAYFNAPAGRYLLQFTFPGGCCAYLQSELPDCPPGVLFDPNPQICTAVDYYDPAVVK